MAAAFFQVLCLVDQAVSSVIVDPVGKLPTELVTNIFRYLDPTSLVAVSSVSRRWTSVCKGDRVLRTKIRRRLREQRKERQRAYFEPSAAVQVTRAEPGVTFGRRNGQVATKALPVEYEHVVPKTQHGQFKVVRNLKEEVKTTKIVKLPMGCSASVRSVSKKRSFTYSRLRL